MRESEGQSQREQIRDTLAENIDRLDSRIEKAWGEDMDAEAEQLQLTRLRTLAHLTREFR